ncbi:MAG: hypothetical protein DRG24_08695 [Epsilonproteobacteria bacterium]|nr:MAG: hypothetical protein DRG24_08695 [Campylobacterota bacterium]
MRKIVYMILLSLILIGCNSENTYYEPSAKEQVVFINGGSIDDYVSYLLLTTMDEIELKGVVVINADTIADTAMQVQFKTKKYIKDETKVGLSSARGWNAFPWNYRKDVIKMSEMEILKEIDDDQKPPYSSGDELLYNILSSALLNESPVTILATAPVTSITDILKKYPELKNAIKQIVWMGGAIYAAGNLDKNTIPKEIANPKAEWNIFWDPEGSSWLLKNTTFPIVLFPLDVTNQAKVTAELKERLSTQALYYRYSKFVYDSYSLVDDEPFFEMWNSVTTAYIARADLFSAPVSMELNITTDGYEQGTIFQNPGGRHVSVILNLDDKEGFYTYVLNQFERDYR